MKGYLLDFFFRICYYTKLVITEHHINAFRCSDESATGDEYFMFANDKIRL